MTISLFIQVMVKKFLPSFEGVGGRVIEKSCKIFHYLVLLCAVTENDFKKNKPNQWIFFLLHVGKRNEKDDGEEAMCDDSGHELRLPRLLYALPPGDHQQNSSQTAHHC